MQIASENLDSDPTSIIWEQVTLQWLASAIINAYFSPDEDYVNGNFIGDCPPSDYSTFRYYQ